MDGLVRNGNLLSPGMVRLLCAVANGQRIKEYAKSEYISYRTATTTAAEARKRLGTGSMIRAVVLAQHYGYLTRPHGEDLVVLPRLLGSDFDSPSS